MQVQHRVICQVNARGDARVNGMLGHGIGCRKRLDGISGQREKTNRSGDTQGSDTCDDRGMGKFPAERPHLAVAAWGRDLAGIKKAWVSPAIHTDIGTVHPTAIQEDHLGSSNNYNATSKGTAAMRAFVVHSNFVNSLCSGTSTVSFKDQRRATISDSASTCE